MTALPNWVIDVVIALDDHEDNHSGHDEDDWVCMKPVLDLAPAELLTQARAIRSYLAQIPVPTDADPEPQ